MAGPLKKVLFAASLSTSAVKYELFIFAGHQRIFNCTYSRYFTVGIQYARAREVKTTDKFDYRVTGMHLFSSPEEQRDIKVFFSTRRSFMRAQGFLLKHLI